MAVSPKGLSDDFNDRITKKCLPMFRDRVIATHLLPYLTCLERIDEELVTAQQNQFGETLAADLLFQRLIRRPNWFKDVVCALRQPNVGLADLADIFEDLMVTVPARWDILSFDDKFGKAYRNKQCTQKYPNDEFGMLSYLPKASTSDDGFLSDCLPYEDEVHEVVEREDAVIQAETYSHDTDTESNDNIQTGTENDERYMLIGEESQDMPKEFQEKEKATFSVSTEAVSDKERLPIETDETENQNIHHDGFSLKRKRNEVEKGESDINEIKKKKQIENAKDNISVKREELRLKFMEKLYSFIAKPEDIPLAIMYMEKINVNITGIDKGSILFNMKVKSLADLDHLLKMLRYDGLRQLLDKELLSSDKVKSLQELAEMEGNPVRNIESGVAIHGEDIERCKMWLTQAELEPVHILDGMAMSKDAPIDVAQSSLRVAKYARDRLPDCVRQMAEDRFLLDRIERFYQLNELKDKMLSDSVSKKSMVDSQSVVEIFLKWFENEIAQYIKTLDPDTLNAVKTVSAVVFLLLQGQNTKTIPVPFQKQEFETITALFPQQIVLTGPGKNKYMYTFDGSLCKKVLKSVDSEILKLNGLQDQILIDLGLLNVMCERLQIIGILRHDLQGLTFSSDLLLNTVIFNMMSISEMRKELDWKKFPFLLQLVAYFSREDAKHTQIPYRELRLKHESYRTVSIAMCRKYYITGAWTDSVFHVSDIFCMKAKGIGFHFHMEDEASQMAQTSSIVRVSRNVNVDLSLEKYGPLSNDPLQNGHKLMYALQWLNLLNSIHSFTQVVSCKFFWQSKCEEDLSKPAGPVALPVTATFGSHEDDTLEMADSAGVPKRKRLDVSISSTEENIPELSDTRECHDTDEGTENDIQIVSLNLSGQTILEEQLQHLTSFIRVTPTMKTLYLRNCQLQQPSTVKAFKTGSFENISYLNISDNIHLGKTFEESLGLMFIRNLEGLDIQNCNLGNNGIYLLSEELTHLRRLTHLNVANNSITDEGLLELSTALMAQTGLLSLHLQNNPIKYQGSIILSNWLRRMCLLEVLDISECGIGDDGMEIIARYLKSRALRKLFVCSNDISVKGADCFFSTYTRPPLLDTLDFSANAIYESALDKDTKKLQLAKDEVINTCAEFLQTPYPWNHICLRKCGIGNFQLFRDIGHYKSLTELTYLSLEDNCIADEVTEDIAQCTRVYCKAITHINLRQNEIGNRGARALASSFAGKQFLKTILLDKNCIGDEGSKHLVKVCCDLPRFLTLDLSNNTISGVTKQSISENMLTTKECTGQLDSVAFVVKRENGMVFAYFG